MIPAIPMKAASTIPQPPFLPLADGVQPLRYSSVKPAFPSIASTFSTSMS